MNLRPTFTPRTLGSGIADVGSRFGGVPSTAVQMAINAVKTSNLVRCTREEYPAVRLALLAYVETVAGRGKWVSAQNGRSDIERLDGLFSFQPGGALATV